MSPATISMNWRGRPLTSHEVVVDLISATTTRSVRAERDEGSYPTGTKVTDAELAAVPRQAHVFHGEWNLCLLSHKFHSPCQSWRRRLMVAGISSHQRRVELLEGALALALALGVPGRTRLEREAVVASERGALGTEQRQPRYRGSGHAPPYPKRVPISLSVP